MVRCPGQDQRYWKPGDIFEVECPGCGKYVEFFKDEAKLRCKGCGQMVTNPKIDMGCAEWCQYAEQCLGGAVSTGVSGFRERFIGEMKEIFGDDLKRIEHALAVLNYAEQIHTVEGGDRLVVVAAAILHDIGIPQAERKHGSAGAKYQEMEGPGIAREIMLKHGIAAELVEHVGKIIANHHSAKDIDTQEFRIVWDADWLVNWPEVYGKLDVEKLPATIDEVFKTRKGKEIAIKLYG